MKRITVEQKHQMRQAFHRGGRIRRQNEPSHKFKMVNVVTSHGYTNTWVLTKNNEQND